jgi:hypothetical protein
MYVSGTAAIKIRCFEDSLGGGVALESFEVVLVLLVYSGNDRSGGGCHWVDWIRAGMARFHPCDGVGDCIKLGCWYYQWEVAMSASAEFGWHGHGIGI